jgi:5'-3' exonuclease
MPYHLLLDISSLMYRAFFALPPSLSSAEGRPVNAVRGYLDMAARLQLDLHPDEAIHVYDHDWRPAQRVAAYAGYKAHRPPEPEGLPAQFELLREVLDAFGVRQAEAPEWEADDAIGTLCTQQPRTRFDIVTGDRDLLQLVRDEGMAGPGSAAVRVLFTVKGVSELAIFDRTTVLAKYGVAPERYVDFAALRGDPSDGLPGVKGVGDKTARALVDRYATLDALLEDLDAQPPRLRASLEAARSYLEAMPQVVPIRRDVSVRVFSEQHDAARLDDLASRYNLKGPVRRLREALEA